MKLRAVGLGIALVSLLGGCASPKKAFPSAALRSGCDPSKIVVVKDEGREAVLNVCGVHENWHYHAFNGWEYKGPSSTQPVAAVVDGDSDGVPDDADACLGKAGIATLDSTTNGCPPPPADADADGIPDDIDKCPSVVGVMQDDAAKAGCPPDADGDSIADAQDACPDKVGVANEDSSKNGCPADKDGDNVPDATDACPDVAGVGNEDAAKDGCPSDTDADGIIDSADACPELAGVANEVPEQNGCPPAAPPKKGGGKKAP